MVEGIDGAWVDLHGRAHFPFWATSFFIILWLTASNLLLTMFCHYTLSGGLFAGGRLGHVMVYVRRDEVGVGAANAGGGGIGVACDTFC